jgi:precorrin-3B synthase
VAKIVGDGTLRVTPWQSIILPNIKADNASLAITKLTFAGLICEADDPLVSMIACAGSTGCKSAFANTKADGLELAYMLRKHLPINIHLSGCSKSCASPSAAEVSLVAVSADRYDVYKLQQIGQSGFGKLAIKNLTITQVADYLDQLLY